MTSSATDVTAVILTGGSATRLRPLSVGCSKVMMPVFGKPLLESLLCDLSGSGLVREVLLTSPGQDNDIRLRFGDKTSDGLAIGYLSSRVWSGTAGAVLSASCERPDALSSTSVIVYGDSILRMDYGRLIEFHRSTRSSMTIACHRPPFEAFLFETGNAGLARTNFGVAELGQDGRVTRFEEKPVLKHIAASFNDPVANAAVYVIDTTVLRRMPTPNAAQFDFAYHVIPWLVEHGEPVYGLEIAPGFRFDLGTLPHYLGVHLAALRGEVPVNVPGELLAPGIRIERGVQIHSKAVIVPPVFIGQGARLGSGCRLECCAIGEHTDIDENASVKNSVVLASSVIGAGAAVDASVLGPHSTVGPGTTVPRGTVCSAWGLLGDPGLLPVPGAIKELFK